jgi:hypothetical protein
VFFIDDDQTELRQWSKYCGPGSDDDRHLSAVNAKPFIDTLPLREGTVEDRSSFRKTLCESIDQLRCEANLGHQDERSFVGSEKMLDCL